MNAINYFKVFIFYSGDVATDVNHLYKKKSLSEFLLYHYKGFMLDTSLKPTV
jgi:hypothetical protein